VSTITVTARGVKTVNDALEEVDAVVEALKDRAEGVLTMLGQELEQHEDRRDRVGNALAAPAVKAVAAGVATKATKTTARKAAKQAAKAAKRRAKKVAKKAAKRAAKKAAKTAEIVDVAKSVAERTPETLHVGKAGKHGKLGKARKRKRAKRLPPPLVIIGMGAVAVTAVVWLRARAARLRELEAVENTPDEFGVVLERAELAGVIPHG
jgi:hypothetical protein